jgi:hypothetical protein
MSLTEQASGIYQDKRTGKRVRLVGGRSSKEDFVLVKGNDGVAYYVEFGQLLECDATGKPDFIKTVEPLSREADEVVPEPVISLVETRLNLNMASAEEIAKRVPGVGYRIAKRIAETRLSLPGERFSTLDQVRAVSNRINWDQVIEENVVFLG